MSRNHDHAVSYMGFTDSGDLGIDSSGFARDGVAANVNHLATLDGKSDVVEFPPAGTGEIDISSQLVTYASLDRLSFSAWVRLDDSTDVHIITSATNSAVNNRDFTLYVNGDDLVFQHRDGTDNFKVTVTGVFTALIWHLVNFTTGPSGWQLWLNKVVIASGPETHSLADLAGLDAWYLGRWNESGSAAFNMEGAFKDVYWASVEIDQVTVDDIFDNNMYGNTIVTTWYQSNMLGRSVAEAQDLDYSLIPSPAVRQWPFAGGGLIAATNPIQGQDPVGGTGSSYKKLAEGLINTQAYNRGYVVCCVAKGNTSLLTDWQAGDTVNIAALAAHNAMIAGTSKLSSMFAMIGCGGENDADNAVTAAQERAGLVTFYADWLANADGFNNTVPFLMGTINGSTGGQPAVDEINLGITQFLTIDEPTVGHLVDLTDQPLFDTYHYTMEAQRVFGTRSLDAFAVPRLGWRSPPLEDYLGNALISTVIPRVVFKRNEDDASFYTENAPSTLPNQTLEIENVLLGALGDPIEAKVVVEDGVQNITITNSSVIDLDA